jgi:hypothetical protein
MRFSEAYYTVQEVAALWRYSDAWVRERVKDGSFLDPNFKPMYEGEKDPSVFEVSGETRIAASALNRFIQGRVKFTVNPIAARNMAELRRKQRARAARANGEAHVEGLADGVEHATGVFRGGGN